jgi:hypothetical protein
MKGLFIISLLCTTVHAGRANPVPDIVLIGLVALLFFIATVTTLWEILKTDSPAEAKSSDFFLIFAVVVVPFTMLIYFGLAIEVYEATAASQPSWPPWSSMSWQIEVGSAVIYFVVTIWLWFRWYKGS